MKNRELVSRWPWLYTEIPPRSLLAAPTAFEHARTSLRVPFMTFSLIFFPPPPHFFGRNLLLRGGFSLHLSPRRPTRHPLTSATKPPHTHTRTHALAGRHKGFQSRPLCPPTAARAAPAPALARRGRVFFGSQRPPLLSISYGTPPGFKADSSGKAGEMGSVGSEGACPLSSPPCLSPHKKYLSQ